MVIRVSLAVDPLEVLQPDPEVLLTDSLAQQQPFSQSQVLTVVLVGVVPRRQQVVIPTHIEGA